ncbi:hypothetical protein CONLIGDRAFT_688217 [Coniochaeta ligniaria NRRL 30616]|uniref:Uncharacterized protein n=1 Tax=Coniochaeta ligniaria NRRL 30616 TaxID=1408157 RepID=A0A1J7JLX9_9PEZI|nr:hypothetical protein CONLIGDRAFT_688217 [Coniochaeta ligniaria NRRL 30616]
MNTARAVLRRPPMWASQATHFRGTGCKSSNIPHKCVSLTRQFSGTASTDPSVASAPRNKIPWEVQSAITEALQRGNMRGTPSEIEELRQLIKSEAAAWNRCRQEMITIETKNQKLEKEKEKKKKDTKTEGRRGSWVYETEDDLDILGSYWIDDDRITFRRRGGGLPALPSSSHLDSGNLGSGSGLGSSFRIGSTSGSGSSSESESNSEGDSD